MLIYNQRQKHSPLKKEMYSFYLNTGNETNNFELS